jgi:phage major head subunit gpT-like protein
MVVNKQNLQLIFVNLKKTFQNAFKETPAVWQKFAMRVDSTGKENSYSWLSRFPKLKEWIGDKSSKWLEAFKYTIVNKPFAANVKVSKHDVKDGDLFGSVIQAKQAGKSAQEWYGDLVYPLMNEGFTNLCYDGQPFFDDDHPVNGQSVSNKGTKKLSAGTVAEIEASYGKARQTLLEMKDEEGEPLGVNPCLLMVPPALETIAKKIVNNEKINNEENPYQGTAEVLVVPQLKGGKWLLIDNTQHIMPFIIQVREEPEFVEQTDMSSDDVYNRGEFSFGCEARGNGGYGLWQLAYGSTGTEAH